MGARHRACAPARRRYLLPSQHRYGDYLCKLLHQDDSMPATYGQTLLLKRIVCRWVGSAPSLVGGLCAAVFQRIWKSRGVVMLMKAWVPCCGPAF